MWCRLAEGHAPRLTSSMLVSALIRRVQSAGGFAAVLHRGDDQAGAILVECGDRGRRTMLLERSTDFDGRDGWRVVDAQPQPMAPWPMSGEGDEDHAAKLQRRIAQDPDLWIVELDGADAPQITREVIGSA